MTMSLRRGIAVATLAAQLGGPIGGGIAFADRPDDGARDTATPIKHVIVIIGENRTFDNLYGTYVPRPGQHVLNLLSQGIVKPDGSPGRNMHAAEQFQIATINPVSYFISTKSLSNPSKTPYAPFLPTPEAGGAPPRAVTLDQLDGDPAPAAPPFDAHTFSRDRLATLSPEIARKDLALFDVLIGTGGDWYCDICNSFQYASSIMGDPAQRATHIKDAADFFEALEHGGSLSAVSYLKPDSFGDGHPASSKASLLEALIERVVDGLKARPELFEHTALFITFDEGGGYWDSGSFVPLDFFGDGPRIPMIVVSKYSRGGRVVHSYADHASVLKFIERNWRLKPLTSRSRDNLPNPVPTARNPYVPLNMPAISDLFDMFDFGDAHDRDD